MVGGSAISKSKPEIIELPKSNSFPNLPYLPKRISGSNIIGMADNRHIIICAINLESMMDCFNLLIKNNFMSIWNQANFTLLTKRAYAASVKFGNAGNHSWLITGGEKYDSVGETVEKLDTTEIFSNSHFIPGPIMPQVVSMHCMLKLNGTHIVSTGGRGISSKALYSVDVLSLSFIWGKLANMIVARYGHACGHYKMEELIVAGGLNIKETEIFRIKFSEW